VSASESSVEVLFRVANVKGVQPFSHTFATTATTAQVHSFLVATMLDSGMGGSFEMRDTSCFPPKPLRPSDQTTLAEAGLTSEGRLELSVFQSSTAASTHASDVPQMRSRPSSAGVDELGPGGAIYEAVRSKYTGKRRQCGGLQLTTGRIYHAPLVRDRAFVYDSKSDRLCEAGPTSLLANHQPGSGSGSGSGSSGGSGGGSMGEDTGMDSIWRLMFEDESVQRGLRPGGAYYGSIASSCGLPPTGPLQTGFQYCLPNPLMQQAASKHLLFFDYNAASDVLIYSHSSTEGGDHDIDSGRSSFEDGGALSRQTSATQQMEARRTWSRVDFLQQENLRPGGLLYKNAIDSFGELTAGMPLIHFPHFGPIAEEHFSYDEARDALVPEQDAALAASSFQSSFQSRVINPGQPKRPKSARWTGSAAIVAGSPSCDTHTIGSMSCGGGGSQNPVAAEGTRGAPAVQDMSDADRVREARLRRFS
jgi:hypothetical protein